MKADSLRYASFGQRVAAYGWDSLIVIVLSFLVSVTSVHAQDVGQTIQLYTHAGLLPPGTTSANLLQAFDFGISTRDMVMSMVLSAFYNIGFVAGEWQATPGKRWIGIKIVNTDGSRLTLWQSIRRHATSGLSVAPVYLGFLTAAFTRQKTALHDIICNSRVIRLA